ncbi:hypothetical protein FBQ97_03430 [Acidobacteria bacterium ACD]|nr:hypothetical protein [Acidobacteria bacterium ACD]
MKNAAGRKSKAKQETRGPQRLRNRSYRTELSLTEAGSPIVRIVPENPGAPSAHHRQVAALVYELAAELERRSQEIRASWAISPEAWNGRLVLELGSRTEVGAADAFLQSVLGDFDLA